MTPPTALVVAVFVLTYVLIASRRLRLLPIGRPAGALLGAVLMVAIGAIGPRDAYAAIDHDTIILLFAMMLLTAYLDRAGFFDHVAARVLAVARTPVALLIALAVLAGVLSAFLVNDTVCLFLTPVVVTLCRRGALPMGPYLIALATSANIGSAATVVGNPQNMIIGSEIEFVPFLLRAGPAAALGLAINVALLVLMYRRALGATFGAAPERPPVAGRQLALVLAVTCGIVAGFFAGSHLGWTTLAGVCLLVIADRDEPRHAFERVDWTLLVFFAALFVVVGALERTGLVGATWRAVAPFMQLDDGSGLATFTASTTIGSNLVSNVPMVLLVRPHLAELGSPDLAWPLLGFVTTVAGNLTLVGSVANLIVAEGAKRDYSLGFVEYLRFGALSTLFVVAAGVPVVWAMSAWLR